MAEGREDILSIEEVISVITTKFKTIKKKQIIQTEIKILKIKNKFNYTKINK